MVSTLYWALIVGVPVGLAACLLYVFWPEIRGTPAKSSEKADRPVRSGFRSEHRSLALGAILIAANAALWFAFSNKTIPDVVPLWITGATTLIGGFLIARALVKLSLVSPPWLVIASTLIGVSLAIAYFRTGHAPDSPTLILIALFYAGLIAASSANKRRS